ncbi:MAG: sulfite oxidase heme-binding subunit YedZ [Nitrospirota bacterium]
MDAAASAPRFAPRITHRLPFVVGCLPLLWLLIDAFTGGLGANPINRVIRSTGWWALALLVLTLGLAPAGRLLRWEGALVWRRACGLFSFFYACLHTAAYAGLDQALSIPDITADVIKRPHVTVGLLSFALMTPPAATSFGWAALRLGERRWQQVHQLVYPAAALGVVHYILSVKVDTGAPFVFAVILTALLALRLWYLLPTRNRRLPKSDEPSARSTTR